MRTRQDTIHGMTYDTRTMHAVDFWQNGHPPDHPFYQRFIVYQHAGQYVVWVYTGARRGQLNQLVLVDRSTLADLYRATIQGHDRRRSLRLLLALTGAAVQSA